MAPRADAPAELRALDEKLAAIAPGPHLERRILGRLRGEAEPIRGRSSVERARRPALVLSFALAAIMAVLLGMEARGGNTKYFENGPPPSAAGPIAPDARDADEADAADDRISPAGPEAKPASPANEALPNDKRPDFRKPARQGPPQFREAPGPDESPSSPKHNFYYDFGPNPGVFEGNPPENRPAPAISPSGDYGFMLYPQGPRAEEPEPRVIRIVGPRRSSASIEGDPEAPSLGEVPPPIAAKPAEEPPPTCESYSTWKTLAHAECEAEGLVLTDLRLLDECGDGMFGGVEALCAGPYVEPEEFPPGYCMGMVVGDGTTCDPPDLWKLIAEKSCLSEGLTLMDVHPHQDCEGGLSSMAKVTCCSEVAPPDENPPPCVHIEMKPACVPASEVEAEAKIQCEAQGLFLTNIKLAPDCGNGGISYASALCCP